MPILDANVILRYLLRDVPAQAEEAKAAILKGASSTVEVLAEVVYVLASVYKADWAVIASTLEAFLQEIDVPRKAAVRYALRLYAAKKLDFVDCVLAGYHHVDGKNVVTFDAKLQKAIFADPLASLSDES